MVGILRKLLREQAPSLLLGMPYPLEMGDWANLSPLRLPSASRSSHLCLRCTLRINCHRRLFIVRDEIFKKNQLKCFLLFGEYIVVSILLLLSLESNDLNVHLFYDILRLLSVKVHENRTNLLQSNVKNRVSWLDNVARRSHNSSLFG